MIQTLFSNSLYWAFSSLSSIVILFDFVFQSSISTWSIWINDVKKSILTTKEDDLSAVFCLPCNVTLYLSLYLYLSLSLYLSSERERRIARSLLIVCLSSCLCLYICICICHCICHQNYPQSFDCLLSIMVSSPNYWDLSSNLNKNWNVFLTLIYLII